MISSPLHLVRDRDPVGIALSFPGPESPLAFDDHVKEPLALASRPRKSRHAWPGLPLLSLRQRYAAAVSLLFLVVLVALVR